jgi:hypothetical protein
VCGGGELLDLPWRVGALYPLLIHKFLLLESFSSVSAMLWTSSMAIVELVPGVCHKDAVEMRIRIHLGVFFFFFFGDRGIVSRKGILKIF